MFQRPVLCFEVAGRLLSCLLLKLIGLEIVEVYPLELLLLMLRMLMWVACFLHSPV